MADGVLSSNPPPNLTLLFVFLSVLGKDVETRLLDRMSSSLSPWPL